jgi:anti-sigma regulatory factor (Ser/Thr protein kinase)
VPSAVWTAAARVESIGFVRQAVADFVIANGIAESDVSNIRIAVSEAATNAVMHAFRDRTEPGSVSVDDGQVGSSSATTTAAWHRAMTPRASDSVSL